LNPARFQPAETLVPKFVPKIEAVPGK